MARQTLLHGVTLLALVTAAFVSNGCATKNFTRTQLQTLDTKLSARLDTNEGRIAKTENDNKELAEKIDAVDKKTSDNASQIAGAKADIGRVDSRVTEAGNSARNAQSSADKANAGLSSLETMFRERNNYDMVTEKQILFPFNSAKMGEDFEVPLAEIARQLKENPDTFVVLEGHTDGVGNVAYNIQLGEKRNDAVTRFLIVNQGVPMYKVYRTSFGKEQPIAPNDSKEGREKNRTVVLRLYRAKSASTPGRLP